MKKRESAAAREMEDMLESLGVSMNAVGWSFTQTDLIRLAQAVQLKRLADALAALSGDTP